MADDVRIAGVAQVLEFESPPRVLIPGMASILEYSPSGPRLEITGLATVFEYYSAPAIQTSTRNFFSETQNSNQEINNQTNFNKGSNIDKHLN